jgi:hypothetical protein
MTQVELDLVKHMRPLFTDEEWAIIMRQFLCEWATENYLNARRSETNTTYY